MTTLLRIQMLCNLNYPRIFQTHWPPYCHQDYFQEVQKFLQPFSCSLTQVLFGLPLIHFLIFQFFMNSPYPFCPFVQLPSTSHLEAGTLILKLQTQPLRNSNNILQDISLPNMQNEFVPISNSMHSIMFFINCTVSESTKLPMIIRTKIFTEISRENTN